MPVCSILGSIAGPLIGGAVSLLGQRKANRDFERGVDQAVQGAAPFSGVLPGGNTVGFQNGNFNIGLGNETSDAFFRSQLGAANRLNTLFGTSFLDRENQELARLQQLRQPSIDAARASLQERLVNRGRGGFARGGGLSGRLFNPETAGLEEAILRAQLGDIGAARQFSQQEQDFLLGQARGAAQLGNTLLAGPLEGARLGIAAANPGVATAGLRTQPALAQARTTQGFFGSLGNTIGGAVGGLFNQPTAGGPVGSGFQIAPSIFRGDTGGP